MRFGLSTARVENGNDNRSRENYVRHKIASKYGSVRYIHIIKYEIKRKKFMQKFTYYFNFQRKRAQARRSERTAVIQIAVPKFIDTKYRKISRCEIFLYFDELKGTEL